MLLLLQLFFCYLRKVGSQLAKFLGDWRNRKGSSFLPSIQFFAVTNLVLSREGDCALVLGLWLTDLGCLADILLVDDN